MLGALLKLRPKGALALPLQERARVIGVAIERHRRLARLVRADF